MASGLPAGGVRASPVGMSVARLPAGLPALAPAVLPPASGLRRDPVLRPGARGPDHRAHYDSRTLFYGGAYRPDRRALVLVGPPPLNL